MGKILNHSQTHGTRVYESEVERLCGYLKNDSIIRWHLGCTQAQIDEARAALARRRPIGSDMPYIPPSARTDELSEEKQRQRRAVAGNRAYLNALARAKC